MFEEIEKTIARIKMDSDTRYDDVLLNDKAEQLKELLKEGKIDKKEYDHGMFLLSW